MKKIFASLTCPIGELLCALCLAFASALILPLAAHAGNGDLTFVAKSGTNGDTVLVTVPFVANTPVQFGPTAGTFAASPFSVLSGTNLAGTLPAAPPNTYFYSLTTSGSSAAVYIKLTGTGTAGWWLASSGTAAVQ